MPSISLECLIAHVTVKCHNIGSRNEWTRVSFELFAVFCLRTANEKSGSVGTHHSLSATSQAYRISVHEYLSVFPWTPLQIYPRGPARSACPCKAIQFQFVCSDVFDSPLKQAAPRLLPIFLSGRVSSLPLPLFFRKS